MKPNRNQAIWGLRRARGDRYLVDEGEDDSCIGNRSKKISNRKFIYTDKTEQSIVGNWGGIAGGVVKSGVTRRGVGWAWIGRARTFHAV